MKKILIAFCCAFTCTVLLTSFTSLKRNAGQYYVNVQSSSFGVDEIVIDGQKYIVVTTPNGGIAICKE
jgi:hypothetical protein